MNIEEALKGQEEQADELLKAANRYVGALKAWKKACQSGHIGNLQKAQALASALGPALVEPMEQAVRSWAFDVRDYLDSEAWRQELQAAGSKSGLRIFDENDTLISAPVVVRALPGRGLLQIGKVNWPLLHPRMVTAELKRLRDRTGAANSQEFLDSLYAVSQRTTRDGSPFTRFRDIYDLFALTPGWKKDNPPAAFAQAIYGLHRSGLTATRGSNTFEFVYPSANFKEKDVFSVIAEDGRNIRYYGIRFR